MIITNDITIKEKMKTILMHYQSDFLHTNSEFLNAFVGAALKKVDPSETNSSAPSDGRSALLIAIRKGAELKHVRRLCYGCSFSHVLDTFGTDTNSSKN